MTVSMQVCLLCSAMSDVATLLHHACASAPLKGKGEGRTSSRVQRTPGAGQAAAQWAAYSFDSCRHHHPHPVTSHLTAHLHTPPNTHTSTSIPPSLCPPTKEPRCCRTRRAWPNRPNPTSFTLQRSSVPFRWVQLHCLPSSVICIRVS